MPLESLRCLSLPKKIPLTKSPPPYPPNCTSLCVVMCTGSPQAKLGLTRDVVPSIAPTQPTSLSPRVLCITDTKSSYSSSVNELSSRSPIVIRLTDSHKAVVLLYSLTLSVLCLVKKAPLR